MVSLSFVRDCIKHGGATIQIAKPGLGLIPLPERRPVVGVLRREVVDGISDLGRGVPAGRVLHRQLVAQVEREATGIGPEEIGLTLEEGKTVLRQVQAGVVHRQVEALQAALDMCMAN